MQASLRKIVCVCVCRIWAAVSVLLLNYYNNWTISREYELFLIVLGLGSLRSEFLQSLCWVRFCFLFHRCYLLLCFSLWNWKAMSLGHQSQGPTCMTLKPFWGPCFLLLSPFSLDTIMWIISRPNCETLMQPFYIFFQFQLWSETYLRYGSS